jgi:ABC-type multidrug transport system ATPase subunit
MRYGVSSATVRYGDTLALDDVTAEVEPGSIVAVVGGDGAGKTTLLRSTVGEVALTSGSLLAPAPAEIGYLPASAGSWPSLSVVQNMDFVGGIYGLAGEDLAQRRTALLERAGLGRSGDRLASQLSGGMRRKLGFCMAFLHRPRLLVLDEPSTGVDPVSRVDLWRLISLAAAGGAAVIMSTTYLDEAERASSLLVLDVGRPLVQGSLSQVLEALHGSITEANEPRRTGWSWRRGRRFHEYWPADGGVDPPPQDVEVTPDLEDVVIALSLAERRRRGVSA